MMNHEDHDEREGRSNYSMRRASPLSRRAEDLMTRTIGCAIEVHRRLGPGFLESLYKRAMYIELGAQELPYERECPLVVDYRGIPLDGQRADLIVGGEIIVELKAVVRLDDVHRAQVISYLRAARLRGGLLINFRVGILKHGIRRIVL
jgi:GxxExxY protein